jgi:hypothetical protein
MRILGPLLVSACLGALSGAEITLQAPLTTLVRVPGAVTAGGAKLTARVTVPAGAPVDLGVGAFRSDEHRTWFQRLAPLRLTVGVHQVEISLASTDAAVGSDGQWNTAQAEVATRGGLFFWSASSSRAVVAVDDLRVTPVASPAAAPRLSGVDYPATATTGTRWELSCLPLPFPANPYDPAQFALDLVVTTPSGVSQRIPGFGIQPMRTADRGDREEVIPSGSERFGVRFRPREPGLHALRLEARWNGAADGTSGGRLLTYDLPPLTVSGPPWDGYVRVDRRDPRFFSVDGAVFWPLGPNLRAVTDPRCAERLGSIATPDRGTLAYQDYLARLAPSGANAAELWLSSWNLALEWRSDWPEFHGLGRYSQERAWRLDRLLDLASASGLRFNVVINNHGQLSENTDREWHNNPYQREAGGFLDGATEFFSDPRALARQQNLRRYLVARFADHPAIMGWKLLSEQDLTAAGRDRRVDLLAQWHADAAVRWKALDSYGHPLTTHWSGSWRSVSPQVASLPGLDFLTIDAYHETLQPGSGRGELLADLLSASTGRRGGLSRFGKPVLVSEFGGNWDACPEPQMIAEHASGGFCALVTGHAGGPMLWWFEWIDQGGRFGPYRALANFVAGEDPRHPQGQSLTLFAEDRQAGSAAFWCRAWSRPGRMLGYVLEESWQATGAMPPGRTATSIQIGDQIAPGTMHVSWWDADTGREISRSTHAHPGGRLALTAPPWSKHLAFKLWRE